MRRLQTVSRTPFASLRAVLPAFALALAFVGTARAHGGGASAFEAPVPLSLVFLGAGATVAVTAGVLALSDRDAPAGGRTVAAVSPRVARPLRAAASVGFLALVYLVLVAGLFGPRSDTENVATLFVWALWFKGIAIVAAVGGSPWRVISPWRTVYRGLRRIEGGPLARRAYPARLGSWPALVGFLLLFGAVENLTALPRSVSATVLLVCTYFLVMVLGGVAFGPVWFERGDPLAVLYRLFGRVAPVRAARTEGGGYALRLRTPWADRSPTADLAVAVLVVAAVYTVSFDGFDATPEYFALADAVRDATGLGEAAALPLYLVGLVGFLAAFALVASASSGDASVAGAMRRLAPTALPIAVAYDVAHNYPYVLANLGAFLGEVAAASHAPSLVGWLSAPLFWGSQVALIVAGHLVAVAAAHVALRGRPARAEVPLTLAMVGYTVLSLWIVSRPVVV